MGWGRCSCGEKRGECEHTNPHIRAVEGNDAERKQKAHREAKQARTSQTSAATARQIAARKRR